LSRYNHCGQRHSARGVAPEIFRPGHRYAGREDRERRGIVPALSGAGPGLVAPHPSPESLHFLWYFFAFLGKIKRKKANHDISITHPLIPRLPITRESGCFQSSIATMNQVFWISASSFQREAEVALSGNGREPDKSPGLPADLLKLFAN